MKFRHLSDFGDDVRARVEHELELGSFRLSKITSSLCVYRVKRKTEWTPLSSDQCEAIRQSSGRQMAAGWTLSFTSEVFY